MIPFYLPYRGVRQLEYLTAAQQGGLLQGDGFYSRQVCQMLREQSGVPHILLTPSASHALELAFWDLQPGDEVILPAYNFPSAANGVLRAGGKPVLCDIDPYTQNLNPQKVGELISPRTRAVCLTHYAGIACDMDAFWALQREYGFLLVEDAAQGVGAFYRQRPLGSLGDRACYSFHATKNVHCGEGGAYLQMEDTPAFHHMQMRRDKGTNRHQFLAGERDFYTWECVGSSHLMSDLNAAMLLAQLEDLQEVTARRLALFGTYQQGLARCVEKERLYPMGTPAGAQGNGHIYYIRCRSAGQLEQIKQALCSREIGCATHFVPLHLGSMGKALGYRKGDFQISEQTADTLLRLPMYHTLKEQEIDQICDIVEKVMK